MTQELLESIDRLRSLLNRGNGELEAFLRETHPADLAEMLEELAEAERTAIFRVLDPEQAAVVLAELDLDTQAELVQSLGKERAGDIVEEMSTDEAADLLAELSPEAQGQILGELEPEDAADVRELLEYPPETAGGIMTTDFVALKADMTAEQAIGHLRQVGPDAETIYYVYVLDAGEHLVGVISLRDLIVARPAALIRDFMRTKVLSVAVDEDQEEVARFVSKYDLLAVPVVDTRGRMLGVVTVDDVIDVIQEEATEDVLQMGAAGTQPEEEPEGFLQSVWATAKPRLPWLLLLVFMELGTSFIAGFFANFVTATTAAMLGLFTVVMTGESGNAATQSLAVVVRGLATGEIRDRERRRVVLREGAVGVLVGVLCGAILGLVAGFMQGSMQFGLAVGLALSINMTLAKVLGGLFPMLIRRMGVDPAVASGPFITTFTDNSAMFVYYGLAAVLLRTLG